MQRAAQVPLPRPARFASPSAIYSNELGTLYVARLGNGLFIRQAASSRRPVT